TTPVTDLVHYCSPTPLILASDIPVIPSPKGCDRSLRKNDPFSAPAYRTVYKTALLGEPRFRPLPCSYASRPSAFPWVASLPSASSAPTVSSVSLAAWVSWVPSVSWAPLAASAPSASWPHFRPTF